jgi:hypothetical protein
MYPSSIFVPKSIKHEHMMIYFNDELAIEINIYTTPMKAADLMNKYFIDKVDNLRKKALFSEETPDVAGEVPHVRQDTVKSLGIGPMSHRRSTTPCRRLTTTP